MRERARLPASTLPRLDGRVQVLCVLSSSIGVGASTRTRAPTSTTTAASTSAWTIPAMPRNSSTGNRPPSYGGLRPRILAFAEGVDEVDQFPEVRLPREDGGRGRLLRPRAETRPLRVAGHFRKLVHFVHYLHSTPQTSSQGAVARWTISVDDSEAAGRIVHRAPTVEPRHVWRRCRRRRRRKGFFSPSTRASRATSRSSGRFALPSSRSCATKRVCGGVFSPLRTQLDHLTRRTRAHVLVRVQARA